MRPGDSLQIYSETSPVRGIAGEKMWLFVPGIHRKGALGIVRNTIKHGSTQKVAVTTIEGHFGARECRNPRLFTKL
jgi:hypothetical protein